MRYNQLAGNIMESKLFYIKMVPLTQTCVYKNRCDQDSNTDALMGKTVNNDKNN